MPSLDHINMTVAVLRGVGVAVDDSRPNHWVVSPGPIRAFDQRIEQDLSNAGPFLAAALATRGTVRIPNWPAETTQVGDLWRSILAAMGATVTLTDGTLTVTGGPDIKGADFDETSELAPTVAALCALATGPSRLSGIAHLRGHETDRLAALVAEINRLGGDAEETSDGLIIRPAPLHGGVVHSYADHRMATAGAILGLAVPGVEVEDIATTAKTMPDFPQLWEVHAGPGRGPPQHAEGPGRWHAALTPGTNPTSGSAPTRRAPGPAPRTGPAYDDAVTGRIITVDRGRYTAVVAEGTPEERKIIAARARELRRNPVVAGDFVSLVGRRHRRTRHPGPAGQDPGPQDPAAAQRRRHGPDRARRRRQRRHSW